MIEYRRIALADVDAVSAFALATLAAFSAGVPLLVSEAKVRSMVTNFAIHREHFHLVGFRDDMPVAAMAMYVTEMPFHERCEGHVMLCYASEPGTGARLVRSMMKFVADNMRIRRVQWPMNVGATRLARVIARRWGFAQRVDNLIYYKGG